MVPARWFWMFVEQLPRLDAELLLHGVQVQRVANSRKAGQVLADWRRVARGAQGTTGVETLARLRQANRAAGITG